MRHLGVAPLGWAVVLGLWLCLWALSAVAQPPNPLNRQPPPGHRPGPAPQPNNSSSRPGQTPARGRSQATTEERAYRPQTNAITQQNSPELAELLAKLPNQFRTIFQNRNEYRLQVILTQINRDQQNRPFVRHHTYGLDSNCYFHPASMVKLPTAALALEKLNFLAFRDSILALNAYSPMHIGRGRADGCQSALGPAERSITFGFASVAHCIKMAFIVSGNVAYDRLYEFVGQQAINDTLRARGYRSATVTARYGHICSQDMDRYSNPVSFLLGDSVIYAQPQMHSDRSYFHSCTNLPPGTGTEYARSPYLSLQNCHEILMALLMPNVMPKEMRFKLTRVDYKLMHKYLSMMPTESRDPVFDSWYIDTRMKYLVYGAGIERPLPNVRIFNKVGLAGRFVTDCAYIVDFENKTEFFLSVTVHTRTQDYGYMFQFLRHFGKIVLEHERARPRRYQARLDDYRHDYNIY